MANKILRFASTDTGTNLLDDADYSTDTQRTNGNQPGMARAKLVNKALRNISSLVSAFAEYIMQFTGGDMTDSWTDGNFETALDNMFDAKQAPIMGSLRGVLPISCVDAVPQGLTYLDAGKLCLVSQATSPYTADCNISLPDIDTMIEGQAIYFQGNRAGASFLIILTPSASPGSTKIIMENAEFPSYLAMREGSTYALVAYPSANAWYCLPINIYVPPT